MTRHPRAGAWLVPVVLLLAGCFGDRTNQPPTAHLISAPPTGSETSFQIELIWSGSDPDGRVDRFEYAIDPPAVFTEEEIAQGGPGVVSEVVPGTGDSPTITRVTKAVDGGTVSFDWVHTIKNGDTFTFSATEPDSVGDDTLRAPTGRFTGMHAFYLRAVDSDGATSMPDRAAFTATTLAPVSRITQPALTGEDLIYGAGIGLTALWTAEDPDGTAPPSRFLYRLIHVPIGDLSTADKSVFFQGLDSDWTLTTDRKFQSLGMDAPGGYLFAVRAVDQAGAVEPFVDWGRNAVRIAASTASLYASPLLTVTETYLGSTTFPLDFVKFSDQTETEGTILAGTPLHFSWQGSAERYSGEIWGYSWGVDIVDPQDDSAWSPWGLNVTHPPGDLVFGEPGYHRFSVKVQDTFGHITMGTVVIHVVTLVGDRHVLFVDDSFDDTYPRDSEHDAFWDRMFAGYPGLETGDVTEFASHGDNDRQAIHPKELKLTDLVRFRMLLWENNGSGFDGDSGLFRVVSNQALVSYLGAGGKLWLGGRMTIGATIPDITLLRGDLTYPKSLHPGQFAWDMLRIHSDTVLNDKGANTRNNLYTVRPFPGQDPPIYDPMDVDPAKQSAGLRGFGITFADAVVDPMLEGIPGLLEPLYIYGATGPEIQDRTSPFQDQLVALRWHDPDPAQTQRRIQWFGFPLYFFQDAQAQETFNRSMDWFREEPAAP